MKIRKVKIHNWRSIKDLEIDILDLMIFIGQNNHGKSNVLTSILFFFGSIPCGELDFNKGSKELFVEITFDDLDDHDKAQFAKYLTANGTLTVRKEMVMGSPFEYHGYVEIPDEEWLKEENISNYLTREAISATPLGAIVPQTGRVTKDIVKKAQEEYIATHKDSIHFSRGIENTNFLGLKSVAQGIFGEVFFIPAVKNVADDFSMKGKSPFNQLLSGVINDMSATNADYIGVKTKIKELAESFNKTLTDGTPNENRPEQISRLESLLEAELATWDTKIDIAITPPDVDEALRVGTNVWIDDGVPTDVNRKGNGLQRSLIFALIKAWARVSKEERDKRETNILEEGETRKASKSTYFIFEEPELYLHPQAQKELFSSLKKLSKTESQVLLTTHSSSFIDLGLHRSICVICKNSVDEGTTSLQCTTDLFSTDEEHKKFNLTYWINPDRGELFFAKKVILVEGPTDKSVISYLAKQMGCYRYDYSVIDCGTKENLPLYIHLLNKFKLKYIAVYDQDHQADKQAEAIASADKSTQLIENVIDKNLGTSVVLVNDIEEEIGIDKSRNKPYQAVEHVSNGGFDQNSSFAEKIRQIYS